MGHVMQLTCIKVEEKRWNVKIGMGAILKNWSQDHQQVQSAFIAETGAI